MIKSSQSIELLTVAIVSLVQLSSHDLILTCSVLTFLQLFGSFCCYLEDELLYPWLSNRDTLEPMSLMTGIQVSKLESHDWIVTTPSLLLQSVSRSGWKSLSTLRFTTPKLISLNHNQLLFRPYSIHHHKFLISAVSSQVITFHSIFT